MEAPFEGRTADLAAEGRSPVARHGAFPVDADPPDDRSAQIASVGRDPGQDSPASEVVGLLAPATTTRSRPAVFAR